MHRNVKLSKSKVLASRRWGGPTAAEWAQQHKTSFKNFVHTLIEAIDKAVPGDALEETEKEQILSERKTVKESSERLIQVVDAIDSLETQQSLYLHLQWILIAAFKIGFLGMRSAPTQRIGEKIGYKKSKASGGEGKGKNYKLRDEKIFSDWRLWKSSNPDWEKKGAKKKFAHQYLKQHSTSKLTADRIVRIIATLQNASNARKRRVNGNTV